MIHPVISTAHLGRTGHSREAWVWIQCGCMRVFLRPGRSFRCVLPLQVWSEHLEMTHKLSKKKGAIFLFYISASRLNPTGQSLVLR